MKAVTATEREIIRAAYAFERVYSGPPASEKKWADTRIALSRAVKADRDAKKRKGGK